MIKAFAAITVLVCLIPVEAVACSCVSTISFEDALETSDEIFSAQISHYHPSVQDLEHGTVYENVVYLNVLEIFKGEPGQEVMATAQLLYVDPMGGPYVSSSCTSHKLNKDRHFLVAKKKDQAFSVTGCSRPTHYLTSERMRELRLKYPDDQP